MFSDEELAANPWMNRRRGWKRRICGGTPIRRWKLLTGDSARGRRGGISARKIAASLWWLRDCGMFGGRLNFELCSSLSKMEIEGATKWDLGYSKVLDVDDKSKGMATLPKAKKGLKQFGVEGRLTTKISDCIKKLDEERATGLKSEYQKNVHSMVQNLRGNIKKEREKCKRLHAMNSKLHRDISRTKSLTRKSVQSFEREKEARKLLEQACNKLAKLVEGNKAEMIKLRNHHRSFQENAEEERQKMQIGQVWKEERAHKTLLKAKSVLEDKCAEINTLIADAEALLSNTNSIRLSSTNGKQDEICTSMKSGKKEERNPHVVRAMKGHIVWARGVERPGSGKKHLEAKLEKQRMLMRNVLMKQRV